MHPWLVWLRNVTLESRLMRRYTSPFLYKFSVLNGTLSFSMTGYYYYVSLGAYRNTNAKNLVNFNLLMNTPIATISKSRIWS